MENGVDIKKFEKISWYFYHYNVVTELTSRYLRIVYIYLTCILYKLNILKTHFCPATPKLSFRFRITINIGGNI